MVDAVTCEGKRKLTGYNSPAKCSSSFFIFFLFCFCKKKTSKHRVVYVALSYLLCAVLWRLAKKCCPYSFSLVPTAAILVGGGVGGYNSVSPFLLYCAWSFGSSCIFFAPAKQKVAVLQYVRDDIGHRKKRNRGNCQRFVPAGFFLAFPPKFVGLCGSEKGFSRPMCGE